MKKLKRWKVFFRNKKSQTSRYLEIDYVIVSKYRNMDAYEYKELMELIEINGFNEISENELYDINGGIVPLIVAGIIVGGAFVV
jgi:lactobin A/cerein 7B family class IIb bacteriocin